MRKMLLKINENYACMDWNTIGIFALFENYNIILKIFTLARHFWKKTHKHYQNKFYWTYNVYMRELI